MRLNGFGVVYVATSKTSGKQYVGKTIRSLRCRKLAHKYAAQNGARQKFYRAIRKYGFDDFEWTERRLPASRLCAEERRLIKKLNTFVCGYNSTTGGEAGAKFSDAVRRRMSATRKGRKATAETRRKQSMALSGKPHTAEHTRNAIEGRRGYKHSPETRAKLRKAHLGRKRSAYECRRISEGQIGRKLPPEWRASMSRVRLGKKLSPEHRAKTIAAIKRRGPVSEATRRRMSQSQKRRWATISAADRRRGPASKETRRKMSLSQKRRWRERKKAANG